MRGCTERVHQVIRLIGEGAMAHNRLLVLGCVSLTKAKLEPKANARALANVRDELESAIKSSDFISEAPFYWIGIILRLGLKNDKVPEYSKISKRYGDLPIAIEIDVNRLLGKSEEELRSVYRSVVLEVLLHVGERYRLPISALKTTLES